MVSSIDVTFSEPINTSSLTSGALTLFDNGGSNLITSAVTISLVSGSTYQIAGLAGITASEGNYALTVNASDIQDTFGNAGGNSLSTSWLMDTTPPTSTVSTLPAQTTSTSFNVAVASNDPSGSNGSTGSGVASIAFYESTDGGAFTFFATVTPANPSASFTGLAGHTYGFYSVATDYAGNLQATPTAAQQTVQILSPLSVTSVTAVSPNPRHSAVASVDVTFSSPIDLAAFSDSALKLTDNNGWNLITSAVSVSLVSGSTYQIAGLAGLTAAEGDYKLTVDSSSIQDAYGNLGTNALSTSWLMDTTPPTSMVGSLPAQTTSTSFNVAVTSNDPSGSNGSTASGVASIAIYDSTDGGPFTFFATVTPAAPSTLFTGQVGPRMASTASRLTMRATSNRRLPRPRRRCPFRAGTRRHLDRAGVAQSAACRGLSDRRDFQRADQYKQSDLGCSDALRQRRVESDHERGDGQPGLGIDISDRRTGGNNRFRRQLRTDGQCLGHPGHIRQRRRQFPLDLVVDGHHAANQHGEHTAGSDNFHQL